MHSAYGPTRKDLLAGGVQLYELKPRAGVTQTERAGREGGVSLHAKAFVVDGALRVRRLDEHGPALAAAQHRAGHRGRFAGAGQGGGAVLRHRDAAGQRLAAGAARTRAATAAAAQLLWLDEEDGKPRTIDHEPEVGPLLRAEVMLLKLLPIDGLL